MRRFPSATGAGFRPRAFFYSDRRAVTGGSLPGHDPGLNCKFRSCTRPLQDGLGGGGAFRDVLKRHKKEQRFARTKNGALYVAHRRIFLHQGMDCRVRGNDSGEGFISIVQRYKAYILRSRPGRQEQLTSGRRAPGYCVTTQSIVTRKVFSRLSRPRSENVKRQKAAGGRRHSGML